MAKFEIGLNIKKIRELRGFEQKDLAKSLGLARQSISDIELGKRDIKADELYRLARFLGVSPDTLLLGQDDINSGNGNSVLWRQRPATEEKAAEMRFSAKCEDYCWLEQLIFGSKVVSQVSSKLPNIEIDLKSFSLNDAYKLAESFRGWASLGEFPASQLINVLEEFYSVKFIVDHECEASAASSRSSKGLFTMINGSNVEVRQHFSIAHELFHLLTWSDDLISLVKKNKNLHEKNEKLADAFAAGLLIPQEKLRAEIARICGNSPISIPDIIALSEQFRVSTLAMLYRSRNLEIISEKQLQEMKDKLPSVQLSNVESLKYRLRSKFVRLVYLAYEKAKISRSRAAKLLEVDLSDLSHSFEEYNLIEVHVK